MNRGVGAFSFLNDCLSELLQIRILNQRDKFRELRKHLLLACRGAWDKAVEIDLFRRDKIDIIDLELRMAAVILHHARDADQRTFLNGRLFIGRTTFEGGRIGELSSHGLTEQLVSLGLKTGRMKTGTPPRIDISSVDTSKLTRQLGDENPERFSFMNIPSAVQASGKQMPCFILHTNEKVHDILRSGFSESPLFTGMITGKGPRYCPSIEDKLRVFPDKTAHQLFLEPEGADTTEYYLQGFSSSLPLQVQLEALHQIQGLENAKIFKPAYAVEYDYFDPTQVKPNLELRDIENLFFAGQINGTTGYEEAAGQGLIAGINASLKVQGKEPFILHRDSSYIGVLIDDLVTKGVDEPYRMFTSRAEFRILLRQDNADERLTALSHSIGLASEERYEMTMKKYEMRDKLLNFCQAVNLKADSVNEYLVSHGSSAISESKKISDLASRPEIRLAELMGFVPRGTKGCASEMPLTEEIVESAEICIKYKGYIDREKEIADKIARLENLKIPEEFDFDKVSGLYHCALSESNVLMNMSLPPMLSTPPAEKNKVTPSEHKNGKFCNLYSLTPKSAIAVFLLHVSPRSVCV